MVFIIAICVGFTMLFAEHLPGLNEDKIGAFNISGYLQAIFYYSLPNLLFYGAIVFSVVVYFRNIYAGFIVVLILFFLQNITENVFSGLSGNSEARFKKQILEEVAEGDFDTLITLDIPTNFKTLSAEQVPYFLELEKLKSNVSELNTAMVDYADLLANLSDPNAISTKTFGTLVTSLNHNVLAAAPSIESESGIADTGLLSAMAMTITENYLKSKQSGLLVQAIRSNQPTVKRFSKHLQKAVILIAHAVNVEYTKKSQALKSAVIKAEDKEALIDELVDLNKTYFADLRMLKRVHGNYGRLPFLHAQVADFILAGNRGLPRAFKMLKATAKLEEDYKRAVMSDEPMTDLAPAQDPTVPNT